MKHLINYKLIIDLEGGITVEERYWGFFTKTITDPDEKTKIVLDLIDEIDFEEEPSGLKEKIIKKLQGNEDEK